VIIYVILVNFNSWCDTVECLESLCRLDYNDVTIVVVDNGSSDESLRNIQNWCAGRYDIRASRRDGPSLFVFPPHQKPISCVIYDCGQAETGGDSAIDARIVLVRNPVNSGFAGGCNVGIRYALSRNDAAFVWLLNNDTVVHPGALRALVKRMADRPDCGMCGSTLLFYDRPDRVQAYGGGRYIALLGLSWHIGFMRKFVQPPSPQRAERYMNYVVGASLFVRSSFLEEIGLMNEEYFLFFEEVDWAFRSRRRYGIAYAPDSIVYHKIGRSIGTSSNPLKKSNSCDYYNLRNRIKFSRNHAPWALPGVYAVLAMAVVLRLCLGRWHQARIALSIMLGKGDDCCADSAP
jgi:GT2 family glycosyltransferase